MSLETPIHSAPSTQELGHERHKPTLMENLHVHIEIALRKAIIYLLLWQLGVKASISVDEVVKKEIEQFLKDHGPDARIIFSADNHTDHLDAVFVTWMLFKFPQLFSDFTVV